MKRELPSLEKMIGTILIIFLAAYPLFSSAFHTELMGKFIVFIIFAIALDLIWGYTGLLSLGHAVFFGLGGYILALAYTFQNGVPPFMQRFDIHEIPWFMEPLTNLPLAFILGLTIPALLAACLGYFLFKSKVSGTYFSIITLALATLFQLLIINLQAYTGGFNGLMGLPRFPIFGEPLSLTTYYYLVLAVTALVYLFAKWLTKSHFGKVITAIRENEGRIGFLTYNPAHFKILIFTISGFLSGLAGMLYVPMNGFISPEDVGVAFSTLIVLWVAIGGRGRLMGAVVGALLLNWLSNLLSEQYPDIWQLFIGIAMVLVVIFLLNGVYGTIDNWWESIRFKRKKAAKSNIDIQTEKQSA